MMDYHQAGLDREVAALLAAIAASGAPALETLTPNEARASVALMREMLWPPVPDVIIRTVEAGDQLPVRIRIYRPPNTGGDQLLPGMIYFHGGGWVVGDLDLYNALCASLAIEGGLSVVSVDYRLAPEHRFPSAFEDSTRATVWIAAHARELGLDVDRLALGGDSAGSALAASTAIWCRDRGDPSIRAEFLLYPAVDLDQERASYREIGEGYILTTRALRWFRDHYLERRSDAEDWRASPLRAQSHVHLPPAFILTCGFDPLRDEGGEYASVLRSAGVSVVHHHVADQVHGFLQWGGAVAASNKALAHCAATLVRML